MKHANTGYEVAILDAAGKSYLIGYTERHSRSGLIACARGRGDAILARFNLSEGARFSKAGGRWSWHFDSGEVIQFTGRTRNEAEHAPLESF